LSYELARHDRMAIRQWLDLKVPAANVGGKVSHSRPLVRRVDFGGAPPPCSTQRNSNTTRRLISTRGHLSRKTSISSEPASSMERFASGLAST
jgi:hypothetical protein